VVNASLNWASIVGIVLAVGGALLYFMRSFKPALARDYDVFFAAIGLLCGGILFFQGWRLDPILQFGQFLLAGSAVFFAYESVRLRGVTTEQARRSSYFDDEEPVPAGPFRPRMGGRSWGDGESDRFDEPEPFKRRIPARDGEDDGEDFYRPRRSSRVAIPERAESRRPPSQDDWGTADRSRFSAGSQGGAKPANDFGARRRERDDGPESRRGSRPMASSDGMPRSSRRGPGGVSGPSNGPNEPGARPLGEPSSPRSTGNTPQGTPIRGNRPGQGATDSRNPDSRTNPNISDADFSPMRSPNPGPKTGGEPPSRGPLSSAAPRPRDNSSRFDD
jgi:hypothetical protein